MKRLSALLFAFAPAFVAAQATNLENLDSLLAPLSPRSIGPVTMGGRITELAVFEREPRIFYVASASGGLWKTENAGLTFAPVFDREKTVSLGAVTVSQSDPNLVWVGTGEDTSRNSVAWGDGVYKSTDGGKTWSNMGLSATMHISKIVLDPENPDIVYVAALGRLWGPNPERGIYKSLDGGKTWKLMLHLDDNTGCIDLKMDPNDNHTLLAAMWERRRSAYDFSSGGPQSGMYKSTDSGRNWRKIRRGLPTLPTGRIGLSYYRQNPKIVIATVEYKIDKKAEESLSPKRPADGGQVKNYAGGTFRSTDGGESWKQVSFVNPRPFYFSLPLQDPTDEKRMYLGSDAFWVSEDAGKTIKPRNTTVHADHHDGWINPKDNNQILLATDGGVFESRDRGITWRMLNALPVAQFYAVAFDFRRPYWVWGGLQDNGSWGIPTQTSRGGITFLDSVMSTYGDGFHVAVDPTNASTVYSESQGGALSRNDIASGNARSIRPRGATGEKLRFNWSTPFILSPHNPSTLYFGANRLFKSINRGDVWRAISPDLTTNNPNKQSPGALSVTPENTGAEAHCTIITISESPLKAGVIYVGTDDGRVHVTQDDGETWTEIGTNIQGLPENTWCSRVLASKWDAGRVYATFDGHRSNDFKPYVYVSQDYGKTWSPLNGGLPDFDSVYVVTEGERNTDLLFLGSEMGIRVSMDRGAHWTKLKSGFPTVAVHDLVVHPRELDLVIATHGRALWTLDITALEGIVKDDIAKDVAVAKPQDVLLLGRINRLINTGDGLFMAPNSQPGTRIYYYLKQPVEGGVKVIISDAAGKRVQEYTGDNKAGLNVQTWSGRIDGRLVEPGDYRVVIRAGGKEVTTSVHVEAATAAS